MERRIPIIEFNRTEYEISCPKCGKPITLLELENESYCSMCGSFWNKTALSLRAFYMAHSEKLLMEWKKENNEV